MSAIEKKGDEKKNFFAPVVRFFKEVRGELRKVVYPTFKHVRKNTTVVIVVVILVGIFIAGLDFVFNSGRNLLIKTDSTTTEQTQSQDSTSAPLEVPQQDTTQQDTTQQDTTQQAPETEGSNQ